MVIIPASFIPACSLPRYIVENNQLTVSKRWFESPFELSPITASVVEARNFFCADKWGSNIFHFLFDVFCNTYVFKQACGLRDGDTYFFEECAINVPFVPDLVGILGITDRRIFKESDALDYNRVDYPQRFSGCIHPVFAAWYRSLLVPIARRLYPKLPGLHLFIQRASHGLGPNQSRNVENRYQVMQEFGRRGINLFYVLLEHMPLLQQVALFDAAKSVVGVHGAGLANTVFCKEGTKVIEIATPLADQWCYPAVAACSGLNFKSIVGDERHGEKDFSKHCLYIDPKLLLDVYEM